MMGARKEGRTKGRPRCKRGRGCRLEEGQLEGVQAGSGQSEETLIQMAFSIFELRPAASGQQSRQLKESERERGEQRREECNLTNERRAVPRRPFARSVRCPAGIAR